MTKALTYVEIDIETCSLTYGTSPCEAEVGVTGANKCFNSRKTCQDIDNIATQTTTLRFGEPNSYLPNDIFCFPCVESVSFSPATVSLGKDLGQRATLQIVMKDFRHDDIGEGFDSYHAERSYNPYEQGTFFGKFRARHPFLRGKDLRLKRGTLGQELANFETYNFIIESFDGPNPQGKYTLIAKDILKIADGDRSQAPNLSGGFLTAGINDVVTSLTVGPSGVGDTDYPASGLAAIGGKEIVSFTRSGDVFTITRAQQDTIAVEHDADSRVQLCLQYSAQDPGDIIRDLLINYAGCPSSYIDQDAWNTETAAFLGSVYTAIIAEPTSIKKLVSELVEQAALSLFWEPLEQKLKLRVLREITSDADVFNNTNILSGTIQSKEQPGKRISQVWTYFAKTNPLSQLDEPESYKSTVITIDADAETEYDSSIIKKIFSRWIPLGGRTIASRVNDIQLARYRDPPRKFSFKLFHDESITLGNGYQYGGYQIQNELGEETTTPIQVIRLSKEKDSFNVEAEEILFGDLEPIDPNDRTIIFDSNTNNVNLKTVHDSLYPADDSDSVISAYIESGVIIGSDSTGDTAFDVGTGWDAGATINIYVRGRIQGAGGDGGSYSSPGVGTDGGDGGDALETSRAITIDFEGNAGEIWAGGGGGGTNGSLGSGQQIAGGGGAGSIGGNGGTTVTAHTTTQQAQSGTSESGGDGAIVRLNSGGTRSGPDGGAPGEDGGAGSGVNHGDAGSAGAAVVGHSFVTYSNDGSADIRGDQTG